MPSQKCNCCRLVTGLAALTLVLSLDAQTAPGKAEVRAIKGHALYAVSGGPAAELKAGTVLGGGTIIKTAAESTVDLFLGNSAGVVRITENSTLGLDKLLITNTGADTVIENQLNLPEGTMLFNVNKLSAASKYEVKLPNGVAGIRGTKGRLCTFMFLRAATPPRTASLLRPRFTSRPPKESRPRPNR